MKQRRPGCLRRLARLLVLGGLGLGAFWWWRQSEDLAALERRRDELRERLTRARAKDPRLAQVPDADVLIGMPVGFTAALARQITQGLLDQVQISLRDIKIQKEGVVKTKMLLGTIQPGRYALDLTLHEASAVLKPGVPRIHFQGRRLGIAVPVTLSQGQASATLNFDWDSQGLGSVVCDDFKIAQRVGARVIPRTYDVKGSFVLSVEDGALVARPEFPDILVRVGVEPDAETWKAVAATVDQRSWRCEAVLKKVNLTKLLKEWLERGFEVRIPERVFKPARLPAAVQQSVSFDGRPYALGVRFFDLRVTPQILWYGADVDVRLNEPPPPPASEPPAAEPAPELEATPEPEAAPEPEATPEEEPAATPPRASVPVDQTTIDVPSNLRSENPRKGSLKVRRSSLR